MRSKHYMHNCMQNFFSDKVSFFQFVVLVVGLALCPATCQLGAYANTSMQACIDTGLTLFGCANFKPDVKPFRWKPCGSGHELRLEDMPFNVTSK